MNTRTWRASNGGRLVHIRQPTKAMARAAHHGSQRRSSSNAAAANETYTAADRDQRERAADADGWRGHGQEPERTVRVHDLGPEPQPVLEGQLQRLHPGRVEAGLDRPLERPGQEGQEPGRRQGQERVAGSARRARRGDAHRWRSLATVRVVAGPLRHRPRRGPASRPPRVAPGSRSARSRRRPGRRPTPPAGRPSPRRRRRRPRSRPRPTAGKSSIRESMATSTSGTANSNHEPHGCGWNTRWAPAAAASRTAAVRPGGASVSRPSGAPVRGSTGRQTGNRATAVSASSAATIAVQAAHQRRLDRGLAIGGRRDERPGQRRHQGERPPRDAPFGVEPEQREDAEPGQRRPRHDPSAPGDEQDDERRRPEEQQPGDRPDVGRLPLADPGGDLGVRRQRDRVRPDGRPERRDARGEDRHRGHERGSRSGA